MKKKFVVKIFFYLLTLRKYIGYAQSKTLPKKKSKGPFVRPDCPNTNVLKYIMKMI